MSSSQESAGRLRYAIFFFVGSTIFVLGVLCDPSFVAGFLSGDRSLGPIYLSDANKAKITTLQAASITLGSAVVVYSLIGVFSRDVARATDQLLLHLFNLLRKYFGIVWFLGIALALGVKFLPMLGRWSDISGHEHFWVARELAQGHGFSLDGKHHWLFESSDPSQYYPTAWADPIYPFLLAGCFRVFAEHGKLAMLLFHMLCYTGTLVLVYQLAKRLWGTAAAVTGATLFALLSSEVFNLTSAVLAGLLVVVCALLALWCLERPCFRRGLVLGAMIGLTGLTHAATALFAPISALMILASGRPGKRQVWQCSLAVVFAAALVISPWTLRNYFTFGEFVPIRTGAGFILYLGNNALADTFNLKRVADDTSSPKLPWTSSSAANALEKFRRQQNFQIQMYRYASSTLEMTAPTGYGGFNEAQRDKVYFQKAKTFVLAEPRIFAELTLHRAIDFFLTNWWYLGLIPLTGVVSLFGLGGVLMTFSDHRARTLALMMLACAAPYLITLPMAYRYRYPIEPLVALFSAATLVECVRWISLRYRSGKTISRGC